MTTRLGNRNAKMSFSGIIRKIVSSAERPMTPHELRDFIKLNHPEFYGTTSHRKNVESGHYKDLDHALLAQIYTVVGNKRYFVCDKHQTPMKVSWKEDNEDFESFVEKDLTSGPPVTQQIDYSKKIVDILSNTKIYHDAFYKAETFHGPSLYFHLRSLEALRYPISTEHLECIYATLASWGMHRMGKKGSKMQSFETFRNSVEKVQDKILEGQGFVFAEMDDKKWAVIAEIFKSINVMASGTTIVGNSKVMHHMLPNIIPPIDREYTMRYLRGNTNIKNDIEYEWWLMKEIITEFFLPIVQNDYFYFIAKEWLDDKTKYPWDTSLIKIVDNLVIGSKKITLG